MADDNSDHPGQPGGVGRFFLNRWHGTPLYKNIKRGQRLGQTIHHVFNGTVGQHPITGARGPATPFPHGSVVQIPGGPTVHLTDYGPKVGRLPNGSVMPGIDIPVTNTRDMHDPRFNRVVNINGVPTRLTAYIANRPDLDPQGGGRVDSNGNPIIPYTGNSPMNPYNATLPMPTPQTTPPLGFDHFPVMQPSGPVAFPSPSPSPTPASDDGFQPDNQPIYQPTPEATQAPQSSFNPDLALNTPPNEEMTPDNAPQYQATGDQPKQDTNLYGEPIYDVNGNPISQATPSEGQPPEDNFAQYLSSPNENTPAMDVPLSQPPDVSNLMADNIPPNESMIPENVSPDVISSTMTPEGMTGNYPGSTDWANYTPAMDVPLAAPPDFPGMNIPPDESSQFGIDTYTNPDVFAANPLNTPSSPYLDDPSFQSPASPYLNDPGFQSPADYTGPGNLPDLNIPNGSTADPSAPDFSPDGVARTFPLPGATTNLGASGGTLEGSYGNSFAANMLRHMLMTGRVQSGAMPNPAAQQLFGSLYPGATFSNPGDAISPQDMMSLASFSGFGGGFNPTNVAGAWHAGIHFNPNV